MNAGQCADGQHWFLAVDTPEDGQPYGCGQERFDRVAAFALGDTVARLQEHGLSPTVALAEASETVGA